MTLRQDLHNGCQMLVETDNGFTLRLTFESSVYVLSMMNETKRSFSLALESFKPVYNLYVALIKLNGGLK